MGKDWALNQRTFREHSIIPHRLEAEPKVKIQQSTQSNTSSVDMIDLWGNPFSSTEIGDASSGQALLREAFASKLTSGIGKSPPEEVEENRHVGR